jgi:hypothetical protein
MVRVCSKYWKFVGSSYSTHVALDQCVPRVYGVKRRTQKLKDQVIMVKLRTRELNLEVLLWQGLKDETLGERGSLWCRKPRPQCSLLLP